MFYICFLEHDPFLSHFECDKSNWDPCLLHHDRKDYRYWTSCSYIYSQCSTRRLDLIMPHFSLITYVRTTNLSSKSFDFIKIKEPKSLSFFNHHVNHNFNLIDSNKLQLWAVAQFNLYQPKNSNKITKKPKNSKRFITKPNNSKTLTDKCEIMTFK